MSIYNLGVFIGCLWFSWMIMRSTYQRKRRACDLKEILRCQLTNSEQCWCFRCKKIIFQFSQDLAWSNVTIAAWQWPLMYGNPSTFSKLMVPAIVDFFCRILCVWFTKLRAIIAWNRKYESNFFFLCKFSSPHRKMRAAVLVLYWDRMTTNTNEWPAFQIPLNETVKKKMQVTGIPPASKRVEQSCCCCGLNKNGRLLYCRKRSPTFKSVTYFIQNHVYSY